MTAALGPIALIVLAIGAVIAVGYLLITHWDTIKGAAGAVAGFISDAFGGAINFIKGLFEDIIGFFGSIPSRIGAAFSSLGDILSGVFKGALNAGIRILNVGIQAMLLPLTILNKIPGIKNVVPNVPQIPLLDSGGITTGPGMYLAAVPEAHIPLDRMDAFLGAIGQRGGDGGGQAVYVVIEGEMRPFLRAVRQDRKDTARLSSPALV